MQLASAQATTTRLMYMQVWNNHQNVSSAGWQSKGVGLPAPEQMPNIEFSVVNFHRPPLGTFHSKFMVVDRKIATISSHNIQDNDNLEMMSHLEGPIVDSRCLQLPQYDRGLTLY